MFILQLNTLELHPIKVLHDIVQLNCIKRQPVNTFMCPLAQFCKDDSNDDPEVTINCILYIQLSFDNSCI